MRAIFGVAVCILWALFAGAAGAQQRAPAQGNELPERDLLNAGTVTVITAPIGGPMSIMGSDMASVLDDGDKLRVLPILGKGSVQNLVDILRLKNIDMGFVTSDALEFAKTEYNIPDIPKRVRYITRLFHNDIHIVARQEIRSLQDLQGKKIFAERSIGLPAARIIFRRMGIQADIDAQTDPDGGLQRLLGGERDAWIASVSKGAPVIKNIKNEAGKFHLLEIPYAKPLQDIYLPSSFSYEEYPNLVAKDTKVYALAVPTVLMVYNWPPESERYRGWRVSSMRCSARSGNCSSPHVIRNGKTPDYRSPSLGWNVSSPLKTGSTKPSRRRQRNRVRPLQQPKNSVASSSRKTAVKTFLNRIQPRLTTTFFDGGLDRNDIICGLLPSAPSKTAHHSNIFSAFRFTPPS